MTFRKFYKMVSCLLLCVCFAIGTYGSAQTNEGIFQNNMCETYGGSDSFAWTDENLFIAHGYWHTDPEKDIAEREDLRYWVAIHYSLTRVDVRTGEAKTLYENIPAYLLHLMVDEEEERLYSVWQSDGDDPYPEVKGCQLTEMDYEGNILDRVEFYIDDDAQDYLLCNKKLYILGRKGIYVWEIENKELYSIYTVQNEITNYIYDMQDEITNDIYDAHCITDGERLYFHEQTRLLSINLDTYEVETISWISMDESKQYNEKMFSLLSNERYQYILLGDSIYYNVDDPYDIEGMILKKMEIDGTRSVQQITKGKYFFKQVNEDGVLAFTEEKGKFALRYYPYENKKNPSFNPENPKRKEVEANAVLIGNNKYFVASDYVVYETDTPDVKPYVPIYDLKK